jgi:hypothetical protein
MATQVIELTPEQEAYLNTPQDLGSPTFTSSRAKHAQALHEVGLTKKGIRRDECGDKGSKSECENGHSSFRINYCGCGTCPDCAQRSAETRIEELEPLFPSLLATYPRLCYIETDLPCEEYDRYRVQDIAHNATRTILSKLNDDGLALRCFDAKLASPVVLLAFLAGFPTYHTLRLRFILLCGESESPTFLDLKQAFPSALRTTVTRTHSSDLAQFLKFLFKPCIPIKSPELCANMELAFTRVRRFRTLGLLDVKSESSEITVEESPITVNSDGGDTPPGRKCPHCGGKIVHTETVTLAEMFSPNLKQPIRVALSD